MNKKIKKTEKTDFSLPIQIMRKSSVVLAYHLDKFWIYPNQVTIFRFVIFGLWASLLLFSDNYFLNLLSIIFLVINMFFDLVDGDLARNHDKKSELGKFLDENMDAIILNTILLSLTLKFFLLGNTIGLIWWIFSLYWLIFSSRMGEYFMYTYKINCVESNPELEKAFTKWNKKIDFISYYFKELLVPKNLLLSLHSNFRNYLIIGVVFNIMPICLAIFGFFISLRWFVLFILSSLAMKDKNRLYIIKILKKIQNEK